MPGGLPLTPRLLQSGAMAGGTIREATEEDAEAILAIYAPIAVSRTMGA